MQGVVKSRGTVGYIGWLKMRSKYRVSWKNQWQRSSHSESKTSRLNCVECGSISCIVLSYLSRDYLRRRYQYVIRFFVIITYTFFSFFRSAVISLFSCLCVLIIIFKETTVKVWLSPNKDYLWCFIGN